MTKITFCTECCQPLTEYGVSVHKETCEGKPEAYIPLSAIEKLLMERIKEIETFQIERMRMFGNYGEWTTHVKSELQSLLTQLKELK